MLICTDPVKHPVTNFNGAEGVGSPVSASVSSVTAPGLEPWEHSRKNDYCSGTGTGIKGLVGAQGNVSSHVGFLVAPGLLDSCCVEPTAPTCC